MQVPPPIAPRLQLPVEVAVLQTWVAAVVAAALAGSGLKRVQSTGQTPPLLTTSNPVTLFIPGAILPKW
jgi:hypothetical protein